MREVPLYPVPRLFMIDPSDALKSPPNTINLKP